MYHFPSHSPEKILAECSDEKLTSPSAELGSESNVSPEISQQTISCSVSALRPGTPPGRSEHPPAVH